MPGLEHRLGKLDLVDRDLIDAGLGKVRPLLDQADDVAHQRFFDVARIILVGIAGDDRQKRLDRRMVLERPAADPGTASAEQQDEVDQPPEERSRLLLASDRTCTFPHP